MEEGTLLNFLNDSVDPYDDHVLKCGENLFWKMTIGETHSFFKDDDDDSEDVDFLVEIELEYYNGNSQLVKNFNQECFICIENCSVYAFRQNGHRCICEICWTISNVEIKMSCL